MKIKCSTQYDLSGGFSVRELREILAQIPDIAIVTLSETCIYAEWDENREPTLNFEVTDTSREPNPMYQHSDGSIRSLSNRWEISLQVDCPKCNAPKNKHCIRGNWNEYMPVDEFVPATSLTYPHNARMKDGLRYQHEQENNLAQAAESEEC